MINDRKPTEQPVLPVLASSKSKVAERPSLPSLWQYKRTQTVQLVHFNDGEHYSTWNRLLAQIKSDPNSPTDLTAEELRKLLLNCHGHNAEVEITISAYVFSDNGAKLDFFLDDMGLEKILNQWGGKNVSVHRDFIDGKLVESGSRATTERMAFVLTQKIINALIVPEYDTAKGFYFKELIVSVRENVATEALIRTDLSTLTGTYVDEVRTRYEGL